MKLSFLDLELALRRDATLAAMACLLALAGVVAHLTLVGPLEHELARKTHDLHLAERRAAAPMPTPIATKSLGEQRLSDFADVLCDPDRVNALVGRLFSHATRHDLQLSQGEYTLDRDKAGGFAIYQATLPVRGSYPKLRAFVDATLAEVRCASLDDIDFRREGVGDTSIEARMRFVFFLKERTR